MENKIIQITKASTLSISLCRGLVEMKRYLGGERDEVFQGSVALDCPSGHRSSRCDSLESLGSGTRHECSVCTLSVYQKAVGLERV